MNAKTRNLYRKARKAGSMRVGFAAVDALDTARTIVKWDAAESAGHVRLRVEYDADADRSEVTEENGYRPDEIERLRADGAYGTVAEFRTDPGDDSAWQHADSCWGHIGYRDPGDPMENPYVADEMKTALDMLREAIKARCPVCHGSGRIG